MAINDNQLTLARYSPVIQTLYGNASSISFRDTMIDNGTLYVQASVPVGKQLIVFNRTLETQEGLYFVDVCSVSSFTGGTTAGIARRALKKGSTPVSTVLRTGITPVGLSVLEYGMQEAGTGIGGSRPTGAPSEDNATTSITGENNVIRITRTGTGTVSIVFRLLCWELPI